MRIAAFAIVVGAFAAWRYIDAQADTMSEIGARALPMRFAVVDAKTDKPIANALVRIHDRHDVELIQGPSEGRTDAGGTLQMAPELTWTSRGRWHRRQGSIRFGDKRVAVTADGYVSLHQDLKTYTGPGRSLFDQSPVSVVIKMNRVPQD